jgi:hypothetical protein
MNLIFFRLFALIDVAFAAPCSRTHSAPINLAGGSSNLVHPSEGTTVPPLSGEVSGALLSQTKLPALSKY